jgi:hypothetical protein
METLHEMLHRISAVDMSYKDVEMHRSALVVPWSTLPASVQSALSSRFIETSVAFNVHLLILHASNYLGMSCIIPNYNNGNFTGTGQQS